MTEFEKWKKELTLEDVAMDINKAANEIGGAICDFCPANDYCSGSFENCYDTIIAWGEKKK